ncbi:DNA methylase, N-6 adenine-specific domain-containing protein [Rozella allomycis CSF55]|uniref:DNA methylase, N-6 adenine-specific domain-containing protein n=1 Tax=Rozella allomycis (strain CSF55) TaxID=988480 RepID=A0A075AQ74_ROZAC|nr:DNA methylase, N-6 adenine-specific domain-containing protein [Rozella allomycis CSF55]|eukprot:EPZ30880.1 DNA methylase, N-6 adenine-specific domain-containing protein [Rozella allomycis CSF55]
MRQTTGFGSKVRTIKVTMRRPETEYMAEYVIDFIKRSVFNNNTFRFLDVCSGSGCISLAIAKAFPKAEVLGIDISRKAIQLSRQNALMWNLTNLNYIEKDIFDLSSEELSFRNFDIIVANPPYIPRQSQTRLGKQVLKWESHKALFSDAHGTSFHRLLISEFTRNCSSSKVQYMIMETNGIKQSKQIIEFFYTNCNLNSGNLELQIFSDQYGIKRFLLMSNNPKK